MAPTHRCDYCGYRYFLPDLEDASRCVECGSFRIYNLRDGKLSPNYKKLDSEEHKASYASFVSDEEDPRKRSRKQSKDIKAKRTSQEYSEKARSRYGNKRG